MKFKEILSLFIPFIAIITGLLIKISNNSQFDSLKKYWLIIIIIGVLTFILRLYDYLEF